MSRILIAVLALSLLAGCGTRLNPFNWFGPKEPKGETLAPLERQAAVDDRPLIDQISSATAERTPGGVIVRAVGQAPVQGWHSGELVPQMDEPVDGRLVYQFRAEPPERAILIGAEQTRQMTVATFIDAQTLVDVRIIEIIGARRSQSLRP